VSRMVRLAHWVAVLIAACGFVTAFSSPGTLVSDQGDPSVQQLRELFAHPTADCRILMRWWWFGAGVTKSEVQRELEAMNAAGIGGVEIATLYPLQLDDEPGGFRNLPYLSDEYLDVLRFANQQAKSLGLRVDVTLGSGWPLGGPHIPVEQAAGRLRVETVAIAENSNTLALPTIAAGEKLVAFFLVPGTSAGLRYAYATLLPDTAVDQGWLRIPDSFAGLGQRNVVFFISSRTGMMVKRPAVGAEGFVLDHYDRTATATHLRAVGDRLMTAFVDQPPYAVFSDSLEDYGSNWTPDLLQEFQKRRGYDLKPHLPALIMDAAASGGAETAAIRHDWGKTLTELANEHLLSPLRAWAQAHHTLLRSQSYGFPPVTLSSNQLTDLPEGEGKATMNMWRQFSDTRWAASAGHLFGKNVISSETWTWLHSPAFRATPLDMKAEADLHFLQGINQLVGHGWPYSPESAGEPGWRMYAAGAFNAHNPWWLVMPELAAYLRRVSFALRLGKPANDVALLLPNDDAWASFFVSSGTAAVTTKGGFNTLGENVSISESMAKLLGKKVIPQILDAGFNLDFIDADAIDSLGVRYPILILPNVARLPLATYQKIEEYAQRGGIVIATGKLPSTAPGLANADADTGKIQEISQRLFLQHGAKGHFIQDETQLGAVIGARFQPDLILAPRTPEIGFIHRRLANADLYFLANTSNRPHRVRADFRQGAAQGEWWNPFTGATYSAKDPHHIDLDLQPYESRLLFFSDSPIAPKPDLSARYFQPAATSTTLDISPDWDVTFAASTNTSLQTIHMATLHSWSDDERFRYYSGQATYQKSIDLPEFHPVYSIILDFGEGVPVDPPQPLPEFDMRAYLDPPVREAAQVFINDQFVGLVWHPPYKLDVTNVLKTGKNDFRIVVGNTAINEMAGRALPEYRLLNDRYGERFIPQDMDKVRSEPSGILGKLCLTITSRRY
jgi:alpha-L-rhamnosidase